MRIALHNPYNNPQFAESESCARFIIAAGRLGNEARMVSRAYEIRGMAPDFVISLSHQIPKLTQFPTYGILTAPTSFFEGCPRFIHNLLSYDGYLTLSPEMECWIGDYLFAVHKKSYIGRFAFSCPKQPFETPNLRNPRLAYFGTNWDGTRFKSLFRYLGNEAYFLAYGPTDKWRHIGARARKGVVPFDGHSVISTYRQAGVGLCLHLPDFRRDNTPSNRIFEITASGAVAISDRVKIIEQTYGDSVLYIERDCSEKEVFEQIKSHMIWIREHPEDAVLKAREANEIFNRQFSLETLIGNIVELHEQMTREKSVYELAGRLKKAQYKISVILRTGGRSLCYVERALESLARQTYRHIELIVVSYKIVEGLETLLEKYRRHFPIRHIPAIGGHAGRTLWTGLRHVQSDLFSVLDDDDMLYPNHFALLVDQMSKRTNTAIGLVYSGIVDVLEHDLAESDGSLPTPVWPLERNDGFQIDYRDDSRLVHFTPFVPNKFVNGTNYIGSNAFLARSELLDEEVLADPDLYYGEDYLLMLLLFEKCGFRFTWEATAVHYERTSASDNSQYWLPQSVALSRAKIGRRLYGRCYPDQQGAIDAPIHNAPSRSSLSVPVRSPWRRFVQFLTDPRSADKPRVRRIIRAVKKTLFLTMHPSECIGNGSRRNAN